MPAVGVVLAGFGGPECLEAVEPFMCSLMGRKPSPEAVAAAQERYAAIGGSSPLPATAERIAAAVERRLNGLPGGDAQEALGRAGDVEIPVVVGMRHSDPGVSAAVARLAAAGVGTIVWVSLSPFDAAVTTGAYRDAVETAASSAGSLRVVQAAPYHLSCDLEGFHASNVVSALRGADDRARTLVAFTAHSLPEADVEADPAYVDQLQATTLEVAQMSGLGEAADEPVLPGLDAFGGAGAGGAWLLAFQSKGARPGAWLGPDLDDVVDAAARAGFVTLVVCPLGFATDHMETLYDLDVVAAARACAAGLEFVRLPAPNDDPRLIASLADAVCAVL
jgi:ferrochelatase